MENQKTYNELVEEVKAIAKNGTINLKDAAKAVLRGLKEIKEFYIKASYENDIEKYRIRGGEDWIAFFKAKQLVMWSEEKDKWIWWTEASIKDNLDAIEEAYFRAEDFSAEFENSISRYQ